MLQMLDAFMQGVTVDESTLALDAIDEVGPGGHYFGTAHTMERYRTEFYRPLISDWQNFGSWVEQGSLTASDRAYQKWNDVLAAYEQPPLDPAIAEELPDEVSGEGYLNSLSPLQLEQYLAIAEKVAGRILSPENAPPTEMERRLFGDAFDGAEQFVRARVILAGGIAHHPRGHLIALDEMMPQRCSEVDHYQRQQHVGK